MELATTDKLDRLKAVCSEKLERIRILQEAFLENESFLARQQNSILPASALAALKLNLVQIHVKLGKYKIPY